VIDYGVTFSAQDTYGTDKLTLYMSCYDYGVTFSAQDTYGTDKLTLYMSC